MHTTIFVTVLIISFLQILHIFEEIGLNAFNLTKGRNPRGKYLRIASVLVLLNYIVLLLLYLEYGIAYYLAFYSVIISTGNMIAHILLFKKHRDKLGYAFPSSIPLGLAGLFLLLCLFKYFSLI